VDQDRRQVLVIDAQPLAASGVDFVLRRAVACLLVALGLLDQLLDDGELFLRLLACDGAFKAFGEEDGVSHWTVPPPWRWRRGPLPMPRPLHPRASPAFRARCYPAS